MNHRFKTQTGQIVERATQAVIHLGAIAWNIAEIRKKIGGGRDLMAVVKADGYGHGSVEVSRTALAGGANCLGVAIPEEGRQLREAGIVVPILVLGLIQPEEAYKVVDSDLEQTVSCLELAEALDQEASKAGCRVNVHVKVDTGMGRIGLEPEEALSFIRQIRKLKNLTLKGLFTHFPSADEADKAFSKRQVEIFEGLVREIELADIRIPKRHMANSAAVLDLPESYFDLVRPGIMIYGLYPSGEVSRSISLRPAMVLRTKAMFVKEVSAGTSVSYGRTFTARKKTRVATIPVGYADGYSRLLSNRGEVLVRGSRVPVIGRVCMDMCMIDISEVKDVRVGDEVILFGEDPSADEVARNIGTINYEVVCAVGKRVPRIYVE